MEGKPPPYHRYVALGIASRGRPLLTRTRAGVPTRVWPWPRMLAGLPEDCQGSLGLISASGQRCCFHASFPRLQRRFASTLRSLSSLSCEQSEVLVRRQSPQWSAQPR
jgi:hypothetical protein